MVEQRFCKPLVGGSSFTRHHKINGLGSKRTRLDIAHLVFSMQAPILPTGIPQQAFKPPLDV